MKYVVSTQYLENYGAQSGRGTYAHNQHCWKFKGGTDYVVTGLDRVQDAVAFVQAYLAVGKKGNNIMVKEFPAEWQSYTDWRDSLNDLLSDHINHILEATIHIDPRGEDVADMLKARGAQTQPIGDEADTSS